MPSAGAGAPQPSNHDVGSQTRVIRGKGRPADSDRAIAEIARRQHGVIARAQLVRLGVAEDAIDWRLRQSRLHRIHRGVYAVGHPRITQRGRWAAAVLACGPGAALSHLDSAAVWDLAARYGPIHVTTDARGRHGHPGIVLHRVRNLSADDRARREGFPVTSVARTLLDLAATVDRHRFERIIERAERLELLDLDAVAALLARCHRRRGSRALRNALADHLPSAQDSRSELERHFLTLCRDFGLPPPRVNVLVEGLEVDMAWPGSRLVVELDGFEHHRTRGAFERDRLRDVTLRVAGWTSVRITDRRLRRDPAAVAAALRALLRR